MTTLTPEETPQRPVDSEPEDEEMDDAPAAETPPPEEEQELDEDEPEEGENEEHVEDEEAATPSKPTRSSQSSRRKSKGGRSKPKPKARATPAKEPSEDGNEASDTPAVKKRGGFRGHRGAGRWGNKRATSNRQAQVPVDDDGNVLNVVNDEVELEEDAEGEEKINKDGELQSGREYRVRTFTLLGRGKRLYMLSTEPARCIGFRDSYLFFQKHKHLHKIIVDEEAKKDLIDRDIIPHSYKGRSIGVVTARSVFREFGAKIIIGGKKITDDYKVQEARDREDVEGDLAVPDDYIPKPGDQYNRNQYVAWHGASSVYHNNLPTVPATTGKPADLKKKRNFVTYENWMLEHAREASRFNSGLKAIRDSNNDGVYDIHTNIMQFPSNLQPTHARWQQVHDEEPVDTLSSRFAKLEPVYTKNFRIHDLWLESAPSTNMALPGLSTAGPKLASIPTDILDELPSDCRQAFDQAAVQEMQWRSQWLNESEDGQRAHILSSVDWFPK